MIELKDLNIERGQLYYSADGIEKLQEARENSILTREQVKEKLKTGEVKVLNPNAEFKTAVYVCPNEECKLSKVHFYNANGELLFTYPWNGLVYDNGYYGFSTGLEKTISNLAEMQLTTTPMGRIVLREHCRPDGGGGATPWFWRGNVVTPAGITPDQAVTSFTGDGFRGSVDFDKYSHDVMPLESRRARDEKWFKHMEEHGDDYINYCSKNYYMI